MRSHLSLVLLLAAGCGSAPSPMREPELVAGKLVAWVVHGPQDKPVLVVGTTSPAGERRSLAHTNGLYLTLKEDSDFRVSLPFETVTTEGRTLRLSCRMHGNHTPSVVVSAAEGGGLLIEVADVVGLQSRVREFAIEYFLDADSPVQESWVPLLHPGPDYVAGDESWQLPLAFLRAGEHALALIPEPSGRELRRLPQALRVDPELRRIRHGLVAQRIEPTGGGTGLYRTDDGIDVQGETLTFRHLLQATDHAEPRRTFDQIVDALFARWSAPQLDGPGDAEPVAWKRAAARLTAEAAARWAKCRIAGKDLGLITSERRERGWRTWFTWRYQPLRTAMALHRMAELAGDEHLQEQAEETVRSLLLAPSRSGLPPALIDIDPIAGTVQCGTDDGADGHAGWLRTLDATWTAYWRLRAGEWLPALREQILAASQETTRFLLANQLPNGAFPAFFEAEYLAPRRDVLFDNSAESAGAALFLAEFGAATGNAEALAAANRTLEFLDSLSQQPSWCDFEIWTRQNSLPANPADADGSIGWLFASLAAVRLAQVGAPEHIATATDLARRFLHRLATFQQVRVRAWHPEDLVGGISCTNLDSRWNDARSGLAAEAFLAGYDLTGDRIWLQRGALALRAVLHAPLTEDSPLGAGAAAGAVTSQIIAEQWGQGVVDVNGGFAQGLDAIWLSGLRTTDDEVWLQCRSDAGVASARVVFRGLGSRQGLVLNVNGKGLGFMTAAQLAAGVNVQVQPQPRFDFRPPAEIAGDLPWPLQVPSAGVIGPDCNAAVELRRGDRVELVPLGQDELTLQPLPPFVPRMAVGTQLTARLLVDDDGVQWTVPAVGTRRIAVSDHQCLDPGDDDESYLQDPGDSRIALFADGREGCRELLAATAPDAHPSMTMAVPVPPQAEQVQIDVWLRGAAQIDAEDRLLHLDSNAPTTARHLQFTIVDRRLWPDGVLPLRFEALGQSLQVARIRYRSEGNAAEPPPAGRTRHNWATAASLRIAVLPLQLDDLPCEATPDQLRTACFGDTDYAMTPAPNPTVTAGSAASVLTSLSGGATQLQGVVLHRLDILLLAAELRSEPDGGRKRLTDAVRDALKSTGVATDLDAVVVVHGGGDRLRLASGPDDGAGPRILFVPERSANGTFLASGDLLYRLLQATRGLPDASAPERGAFGDLALGGAPPEHQPAGPLAIDREKLGWVDRIELDQDAELEVPTLQQDRAFLALRCSQLPGRGDLIVEGRKEIRSDAGGDGLLVYWDQAAAPVLIARTGESAWVTRLRLGPVPLRTPTPFFPAMRQDLFSAPFAFGPLTHPSLATPQGEVPWTLDLRHEPSRSLARVKLLMQEIDNWREAVWRSVHPSGEATPMPIGLDLDRNGSVLADEHDLVVRPPQTGSIEGVLQVPRQRGLQRLFMHLQPTPGSGTKAATAVRIASGTQLLASVTVEPARPATLELDVPPELSELRLAFAAVGDTGCGVRLRQCTLVPRQPAWTVLTPPQQTAAEHAWMDGTFHSLGIRMRTDPGGRATLELPLILAPDPMQLRLVAGLPLDGPADVRMQLRLTLRSLDGTSVQAMAPELQLTRDQGTRPLWTALIAMQESPERDLRMLRLDLSGPPDTELWIQTIEVCAQ